MQFLKRINYSNWKYRHNARYRETPLGRPEQKMS